MAQVTELFSPPKTVPTVSIRVLKPFKYARQRFKSDHTVVNLEPVRMVTVGEVLEEVLEPFAEGVIARGRAELC